MLLYNEHMDHIKKKLEQENEALILYGAGNIGQTLYSILRDQYGLRIRCFCDRDSKKQQEGLCGLPVISKEELLAKYSGGMVVIATCACADEIKKELLPAFTGEIYTVEELIEGDPEIRRELCASAHIIGMDTYFDLAESDRYMDVFWGADSPFLALFRRLDLTNVLELACGRGRHVQRYEKDSGHVTLVDVLEKNILLCKERFGPENPKITYLVNNGYDLREIADASQTSLFTYDAMVHFESLDVYSYLRETNRILRSGGYALFHHSNSHDNYKASFHNGVEGRAYMSAELFAHFAYKAGLEVAEQRVIDWELVNPGVSAEGRNKNLDAITLVRKL